VTKVDEVVAERDRSVVRRVGDDVVKEYRRPDPRNEVERQAYEHLAGYAAPVPAYRASRDGSLILEDVRPITDYEAALRSGDAASATRALGQAYAALHDVPPPGPVMEQPLPVDGLARWCEAVGVAVPDLRTAAAAAFAEPGAMLAFSHGDPAPSNALLRANGDVVLIDFEYAGSRHRGYDIAAWHVLCPLEEPLLAALHDGYGREIDDIDALIAWRAAQVIAMVPLSVLQIDRDFAPGWSSRAAIVTAARRSCLNQLHDALASRWPEAVDRLPTW
jgi:Ser/Thr protein kinase RdoA (MazF antagonist)